MNATAVVTAVDDGHGSTRLAEMRSVAPLVLRATPGGLYLVGGAAGPIGGDRLRLRIEVGPGASLTIRTAAASVALPGRSGRPSDFTVDATVADGGSLRWLPEPAVAAVRCHHRLRSQISVGRGGCLVWREELVLGRHGEDAGRYVSRTSVDVDRSAVLRQELAIGENQPGWKGPAVTGGLRAVGSVVVVDPRFESSPTPPSRASLDGRAAVLALPGPAMQVLALADDAVNLRRLLDIGTPHPDD
ncbi:MAG: urease accessory protein UreD [Actinobacteria bacterium]|nr:urease accessory protein UreD [Actinomycetota bacterium]